MARTGLILLFSFIFCVMLAFTVQASLVRNVFDNAALMSDVWFQATLVDAYLGFLTFFVWVAWKERTLHWRIGWFVLIMAFGNMAMAVYVLLQLRSLRPEEGMDILLARRNP